MRKPRKNYTPTEKVAIFRCHLIDRVPVSDLCDEYRLSPTLFYLWQNLFFENGTSAFRGKADTAEQAHLRIIAALQEKLRRKNEVVSELGQERGQGQERGVRKTGRTGTSLYLDALWVIWRKPKEAARDFWRGFEALS
jgi:transposase